MASVDIDLPSGDSLFHTVPVDYSLAETPSIPDNEESHETEVTAGFTCSYKALWVNFDTVTAEARPDCKHCNAKKDAIVRLVKEAGANLANVQIWWTSHDFEQQNYSVTVKLPGEDTLEDIFFFHLMSEETKVDGDPFHPDVLEENPGVGFRRLPSRVTKSEASLQFALSCISYCIKNHTPCGSALDQPLPTRVLYVGTTEEPSLYLHESLGQMARYVCLSHCWGNQTEDNSMLQTTTDTVDRFKIHISWSRVPKTFQDGIQFIRRIGIKYIWIDSLCIVQDDADDKAREIGQMASVFSNALFTVAAASASGPSDGMFSTLSEVFTAKQLPSYAYDCNSYGNGPLFSRRLPPHIWEPKWLNKKLYPLLYRGWTLQERLLSKRILYFTKEELMWECMSASGCECGIAQFSLIPRKDELIPQDSSIERWTRDAKWAEIVKTYSLMKLTYGTDTLRALSGLATLWQTIYPDEYLAGLWRTGLVKQMLWTRIRMSKAVRDYQAPSWSWASHRLGCAVSMVKRNLPYGGHDFRDLAQILSASCVPLHTSDPNGAVSSGCIRLAAKACPGKLTYTRVENPECYEASLIIRGKQVWGSIDCYPEGTELDVYALAMMMLNCGIYEIPAKQIYYLVLSSNGGRPETFKRQGVFNTGISETEDDYLWWTSQEGDGWTEFTIV